MGLFERAGTAQALVASIKLDSCARIRALNLPHNLLEMCAQQRLKPKPDRDNDQLLLTTFIMISVVVVMAITDGKAVGDVSTGHAAFTRSIGCK